MADTKSEPVVFVTGASRSGTTLMSFVLRSHPKIFGLKELQYFGDLFSPQKEKQRCFTREQALRVAATVFARQNRGTPAGPPRKAERQQAEAYMNSHQGSLAADDLFANLVQHLADSNGKQIPCEQTPRNIFYADYLLSVYAQARIVHMVRDPRAVVASQKRRWRRHGVMGAKHGVSLRQFLRAWINYHPFTAARLWNKATASALRYERHSRVMLVRFEELLTAPERVIRDVCDFLNIEFHDSMMDVGQVNSSHAVGQRSAAKGMQLSALSSWRDTLSRAEIFIVERRCADLMTRCRYQTESTQSLALRIFAAIRYGFSYVFHVLGVISVNPRRALIQARALATSTQNMD